ncbi:MAG: hypothetical protein ACRD9W_05925 [Terriglobia bacterium]
MLSDSLQHMNRFTLDGKSLINFIVLGLAVLVPSFIVFSVIACIRTPIPRRKWLWIVFILLGLGQFGLNWTTGETEIRAFAFQVLGASVTWVGPYAPMMLAVSIPVGAIVFWLRRRTWHAPSTVETAEAAG